MHASLYKMPDRTDAERERLRAERKEVELRARARLQAEAEARAEREQIEAELERKRVSREVEAYCERFRRNAADDRVRAPHWAILKEWAGYHKSRMMVTWSQFFAHILHTPHSTYLQSYLQPGWHRVPPKRNPLWAAIERARDDPTPPESRFIQGEGAADSTSSPSIAEVIYEYSHEFPRDRSRQGVVSISVINTSSTSDTSSTSSTSSDPARHHVEVITTDPAFDCEAEGQSIAAWIYANYGIQVPPPHIDTRLVQYL